MTISTPVRRPAVLPHAPPRTPSRAPPRAIPPGPLPTSGLTLLELDPLSEALFVGMRRCGSGEPDWRGLFLEAKQVCQRVYSRRYPDYPLALEEPHDANACLLYSRAADGAVSGVLRVCFDSVHGLPAEPSLPFENETLRRCGIRVAEPGRFAIPEGDGLYKGYIRALYQVARAAEVELYLMQVRARHADFYRRNCAASDLDSERAAPGCVNLAWNIRRTPHRFFRVFGADQDHLRRFLAARGDA